MKLPDSFLRQMKDLCDNGYDDLIASFNEKPYSALRVNTTRMSCEEFEKKAPFSIGKIPYSSNGYYINDTDAWSKHPYYYAGVYYLQEPSAMLPACTIPIEKDDAVLDLCAAPGGKSTAITNYEPKVLISNDISPSRSIPLVYNLEHTGTFRHAVTVEDPQKLEGHFHGMFDKILVDAPCSGEGMFRKDRGLVASYIDKGCDHYRPIQESLLESAYVMLRAGGLILYSTCTFSDIEDEQVIRGFLDRHDDMEPVEIKKANGLTGPYHKYEDDKSLRFCVHAFPHLFKGEGHFMALMKKAGFAENHAVKPSCDPDLLRYADLSTGIKEFSLHLSGDFRQRMIESRYLIRNDAVYMLPESVASLYSRNVRFARTGLNMGKLNRAGKFTPSTALALALAPGEHDNVLDLSSSDPDVIRYLRGETLVGVSDCGNYKKHSKGNVLLCVDGISLGFASFDGSKYKNLYEKGWKYT